MAFIASHWYIWFVSFTVFGGCAFALQLRNINRMRQDALGGMMSMMERGGPTPEMMARTFGKAGGGLVQRMIPVMICGALASVSGIVLLISVIANLIAYGSAG